MDAPEPTLLDEVSTEFNSKLFAMLDEYQKRGVNDQVQLSILANAVGRLTVMLETLGAPADAVYAVTKANIEGGREEASQMVARAVINTLLATGAANAETQH